MPTAPNQPTFQVPSTVDQQNPVQASVTQSTTSQPPASQHQQAPMPMSTVPAAAQDTAIIEGEWIAKAQQIVAATSNDPFEQNRQLAALKADYMQKRYNKTVKLSEQK